MERLNIVLVLGRSREGGVVKERKKKSLCSDRNELDDLRGEGGDFGVEGWRGGVEESPFLAPDYQN